jgi:hypothetical protein
LLSDVAKSGIQKWRIDSAGLDKLSEPSYSTNIRWIRGCILLLAVKDFCDAYQHPRLLFVQLLSELL